ncbi:MAG: hypothetical protein NTW49_00690 [Bacteroidia bacterium]|nr:hypothetical protein [Bacteroidia bacterium]
MNNVLCCIILLLPAILAGQDRIKWEKYINSDFHFSLSIPGNYHIVKDSTSYADYVLDLPVKHSAVIANRLYITLKKSDTCCSGFLRQWSGYNQAPIQKVNLNGHSFYYTQSGDASMGCEVTMHYNYAICDTANKSCLIFSSYIDYRGKYSEQQGCLGTDINSEIETAKKVVASLKFIK